MAIFVAPNFRTKEHPSSGHRPGSSFSERRSHKLFVHISSSFTQTARPAAARRQATSVYLGRPYAELGR